MDVGGFGVGVRTGAAGGVHAMRNVSHVNIESNAKSLHRCFVA